MTKIILLHLSDLHFGSNCRFPQDKAKEAGQRLAQAMLEFNQSHEWHNPQLVVTTGDISDSGHLRDFQKAGEFFEALVGDLGLSRSRFLFLPGNHDISWPACKTACSQLEEEDAHPSEQQIRLAIESAKFKYYRQFLNEFYGESKPRDMVPLASGASVYTFSELGLTIAALNSCERESHRTEDHHGLISAQQSQEVMDVWQTRGHTPLIKVIALHHNLGSQPEQLIQSWLDWSQAKQAGGLSSQDLARFKADAAGIEGRKTVEEVVRQCQVQLVLHGHQHAEDLALIPWIHRGSALVLAAGSLGAEANKLPPDYRNTCNLIELDPGRGTTRLAVLQYQAGLRSQGKVTPGSYAPQGEVLTKDLSLPQGWQRSELQDLRPKALQDRDFLQEYRRRLRGRHIRWNLATSGVPQPGGSARPISASLDDMYLPIRLAAGHNLNETEKGKPLGPAAILGLRKPLMVRGPAGSGKTTWLRWTFRRLLDEAFPNALPIMIELRRLAGEWAKIPTTERSLNQYISGWAKSNDVSGWDGVFGRVMARKGEVVPVLLVDGWDELGDLGEALREKLACLMAASPHAKVVVTSRPFGNTEPGDAEGFRQLDIQPLNQPEIELMSRKFFTHCYDARDPQSVQEGCDGFLSALSKAHEAQDLAKIPLLLTMMLLISRHSPLPDKRHKLYEKCVENLLTALPDQRSREGAQTHFDQWCPPEAEVRMQAVAALAHGMQISGYKGRSRSAVPMRWEDMADMLPHGWNKNMKFGFLAWLTGAAGLLNDRRDGTLTFSHLSFQEYLTAWHLAHDLAWEKDRAGKCLELLPSLDWWETLRLWAALLAAGNRLLLHELVGRLEKDERVGLWFVLTLFADGCGPAHEFQRLALRAAAQCATGISRFARSALEAWGASNQASGKKDLGKALAVTMARANWFEALRLQQAAEWADTGLTARPEDALNRVGLGLLLARDMDPGPAQSAMVPVLAGLNPLLALMEYPDHFFLSLLNTTRQVWASRLQSLGAQLLPNRDQFTDLGSGMVSAFAKTMNTVPKDLKKSEEQDLARDLARYLAPDLARYLARDLAPDLARDFARDLARGTAWRLARDLARDLAPDLAPDLARIFGLDTGIARHADFVFLELGLLGRFAGRPFMANLNNPQSDARTEMFRHAARLHYRPEKDPQALTKAMADFEGDPLWPALARQVAGCAGEADRNRLLELALYPQKREPPLRWALQFSLRGDIMLPDETTISLDGIFKHAGLEPPGILA